MERRESVPSGEPKKEVLQNPGQPSFQDQAKRLELFARTNFDRGITPDQFPDFSPDHLAELRYTSAINRTLYLDDIAARIQGDDKATEKEKKRKKWFEDQAAKVRREAETRLDTWIEENPDPDHEDTKKPDDDSGRPGLYL